MPKFRRGFPVRLTWCRSCQMSRHTECDHRMNDGAVDAQEFVSVPCKCPCEGQLREGELLIDLVAQLRQQIRDEQARQTEGILQEHALNDWGAELVEAYDVRLHDALFDDEAKLNVHQERLFSVLDEIDKLFDASPIESVTEYFSEQNPERAD